jgi:hypothetical protein
VPAHRTREGPTSTAVNRRRRAISRAEQQKGSQRSAVRRRRRQRCAQSIHRGQQQRRLSKACLTVVSVAPYSRVGEASPAARTHHCVCTPCDGRWRTRVGGRRGKARTLRHAEGGVIHAGWGGGRDSTVGTQGEAGAGSRPPTPPAVGAGGRRRQTVRIIREAEGLDLPRRQTAVRTAWAQPPRHTAQPDTQHDARRQRAPGGTRMCVHPQPDTCSRRARSADGGYTQSSAGEPRAA